MKAALGLGMIAALLGGAAHAQSGQSPAVADPAKWPRLAARPRLDPAVEARISGLMARMSVEDKVGQLIQADIASVTPADLETYKLGSILNGGNSGPGGDDFAPPAAWLALADQFHRAALKRSDGRPAIPVIWGTDAVHGNNNIVGATLFPHNIGLGAARDPALIEAIGRVTAEETATVGQDWSFAPTVAVARDDRWGRSYESYSEDPAVVASYAGRVVTGLQGAVGTRDFMGRGRVMATAKHFLADGGTENGRDQGDARIPEASLRDIHAAGYRPALEAGVLTVMASFSSWTGTKITANRSLLTGVLKERWGFPGFVVGDWNAHGQLPGCAVESCAAAINAGLDMFMVSGDWKRLYANTLAQVRSGEIAAARLDDAVRRILRVKIWAGAFEAPPPGERPLAGRFDLLGTPAAKALARRAVRESLVLLKNEGGLLPLKPSANILIAGAAADSVARAAGGWSITWQGTGVSNASFPNATTIRAGIEQAVRAAGGRATFAADGRYATKPDVAIVVFGEPPYAEFIGDRANLEYSAGDKSDLALLRRLKAAGVKVVAVFLSGRPLWVNAELNAADAFVAAFLPGSEGAGVADLLFRSKPDYDFRGRLSFSWPKRPDQYVLNRGDAGYDPLFPLGYGLTYASRTSVPALDETRPAGLPSGNDAPFLSRGRMPEGWTLILDEGGRDATVSGNAGRSAGGGLSVAGVDRAAQEDARRFTWTAPAEARLEARPPLDLGREANGGLSLVMQYRVDTPATAPVSLGMGATTLQIGDRLRAAPTGAWTSLSVPLRCLVTAGLDPRTVSRPFVLRAAGPFALSIADIRLAQVETAPTPCPEAAR